jgi:hypothetical protein
VCAGIALASALLALRFLPRRAEGAGQPEPQTVGAASRTGDARGAGLG